MKHYSTILEALLASCFLFACTQKEEVPKEIPVDSVTISQPAAELKVGETLQLRANVSPSQASNAKVSWSSSRQAVATVSDDGLVVAVAEGGTTIYATAGSKRDQCEITVISQGTNTKTVSSVSIDKNEVNLNKASTVTLIATVLYSDGSTSSIANWSSSNSNIASVDANSGVVTGVNKGDATITAENGGKKATCLVHVVESGGGNVAVTSVSISPTTLSLQPGQSYTLTATVLPDNATNKTVSWSSSNTSIATVSNGVVKAIKAGSATIKAKAENCEASCSVSVSSESVDPNCVIKYKTSGGQLTSSVGMKILPSNIEKIGTLVKHVFENGEGMLIFKDPVYTIPEQAFYGSVNLKEVELPNCVKSIKSNAFNLNNNPIVRISVGTSLEEIGSGAFIGCKFTSITIPSTVKTIGGAAFQDCVELEAISIPCQFDYSAFSGCTSLRQVNLPSGITTIPDYAFKNCTALTSISFPSSVVTIGNSVFEGCKTLSSVSFNNGLKAIGNYAFSKCSSLYSIYPPSSLETMGVGAFDNCPVEKIYLSNLKNWCEIEYGGGCFSETNRHIYINNSEIIDLVIPDGTTRIGESAFISCKSLRTVLIPSSVVESYCNDNWGISAFEYSTNIYKITVGQTLAKSRIRAYCGDASKITEIIITNTTELVHDAFNGCKSLTQLTLPKDLTKIGRDAFYNCVALTSLTVLATTPPSFSGALKFDHSKQLSAIYVPKESVQAYQKAWSQYSSLIKAIE